MKPITSKSQFNYNKEKKKDEKLLKKLKDSVIFYKDSTEPVGLEDWEALS